MKYVYIVRGQDFYGNTYSLGAFLTESDALAVCDTLNTFAEWQEQQDEAEEQLDYTEDTFTLTECPNVPEKLIESYKGDIKWEECWLEKLPLCFQIEDCDLY